MLTYKQFIFYPRYTSAQCEVSLTQQSSPVCKLKRSAALAQNKKIWTLKHDPASHDFTVVNMTSQQLAAILLKDPFTRYYTTLYSQTTSASGKSFDLYNNITAGQEITDISEHLRLTAFFQSALEPVMGVNIVTSLKIYWRLQ